MASGELPRHLGISLQRIGQGFLLGAIPGLVLGLTMGWIRPVRLLLDPLISAFFTVPRLALFPLLMMIFGVGEASKIVIIAIGVFFPTLINSVAGVRAIHEVHFEVARSYGARPWSIFTRVVLPGSLPLIFAGLRLGLGLGVFPRSGGLPAALPIWHFEGPGSYGARPWSIFTRVVLPGSLPLIFAGLRLSLGLALLLVIGIEFISARTGLGALLWFAWETFKTEHVYVGMLVAASLGAGIAAVLRLAEHWLLPWSEGLFHR